MLAQIACRQPLLTTGHTAGSRPQAGSYAAAGLWLALTDTHKQLQGRAIRFGNSLLHTPAAAHTLPADTAQPHTQGDGTSCATTHTESVQGVDVSLLRPSTQTCAPSQSLPGAHARPPALHRNPFETPSKRMCHATCCIQEAQHFRASNLCIAVLYSRQASGLCLHP